MTSNRAMAGNLVIVACAALITLAAAIAAIMLVIAATAPEPIQPYSVTVLYHGMTCTEHVDSAGNGSIGDCSR